MTTAPTIAPMAPLGHITPKQRRELHTRLNEEAARRGLRLEHRTSGTVGVWDVRDVARGTLAVRGARLAFIAQYLDRHTNP